MTKEELIPEIQTLIKNYKRDKPDASKEDMEAAVLLDTQCLAPFTNEQLVQIRDLIHEMVKNFCP